LDVSEESLNETLLELEWFKKISGLKINFSKTQVIWIGSKKYSNKTLIPFILGFSLIFIAIISAHSMNK
jgi:hypothetical protein